MDSIPQLSSNPQAGVLTFDSAPDSALSPLPILVPDRARECAARILAADPFARGCLYHSPAVDLFFETALTDGTPANDYVVSKFLPRLYSRVRMPHGEAGCWLAGSDSLTALPCFSMPVLTYRVTLAIATGVYPRSPWMACHRCGVGECVAPHHLYWGDAFSNAQDTVCHGQDVNSRRREAYRADLGDEVFRSALRLRLTARGSYLGHGRCGRCVAAISFSGESGSKPSGLEPFFLRRAVGRGTANPAPLGACSSI